MFALFWAATLPSTVFSLYISATVIRHERLLVEKAFFNITGLVNPCVLRERDYRILAILRSYRFQVRATFIAQPPPRYATIETMCYLCFSARREMVKSFQASRDWLTFGDIVQAARLHGTCQGDHETRGWKVTADISEDT